MSKVYPVELTEAERLAILNALNYFGRGCSAGECSTLVGMEQEKVQSLFDKIDALSSDTPTSDGAG